MNSARVVALIVVLTLAILGYQYWKSTDVQPELITEPATAPQVATEPEAIPGVEPVQEDAVSTLVDKPGCLTLRSYEELPAFIQDSARLQSISVNGAALNAYQSLDEATLHGYAEQGDSAAMAIIGAISVMRAFELDDSLAVEWLNDEHVIYEPDTAKDPLSSAASLALNDASYWFYQAALHGRLFALQNYGEIKDKLFGGPVGLGWFTQEEFDALSNDERLSLVPEFLYAQVAYDIAPPLREGALGEASWEPQSDVQRIIREELVADFEKTLSESGLPPINVAPTALPEIDELTDMLCDSVLHEEARRRSLE